MSITKCLLDPQPHAQFLGMILCSVQAIFRVPEEKMLYVMKQLTAARDSSTLSRRQLASLAGMVLALSPAVPLAPIYAKIMYLLMTGQSDWDVLAENPAELRSHLEFLTRTIPEANDKRWKKAEVATLLVGDASDYQYGGFTPNGELAEPFVQPFNPNELERMANNDFSSTLRETLNLQWLLLSISKLQPQLVQHRHVLYQSDNQGMVADINKQGGTKEILQAVFRIHELARMLDCELSAEWHPREDQWQQHADMLSKLVDQQPQQCSASKRPPQQTSIPQGPSWAAQNIHTRCLCLPVLQQDRGQILLRFYCEGTLGVNALRHPWGSLHGSKQFCYIFGPFGLMPETVKKIGEEQCEGVLVYPDWHHRGWRASIEAWKQKVIAALFNA